MCVCVFGSLAPVSLCGAQIPVFLLLHIFRQRLCYFYLLKTQNGLTRRSVSCVDTLLKEALVTLQPSNVILILADWLQGKVILSLESRIIINVLGCFPLEEKDIYCELVILFL